MKLIGERVDHRDAGVGSHFLENALLVDARDDALNPALEIARDIGDGLAGTERRRSLRVVQKNDGTAHALNADVEGDTRAKRGLFKNQRDELAVKRGGVPDGALRGLRRQLGRLPRKPGAA